MDPQREISSLFTAAVAMRLDSWTYLLNNSMEQSPSWEANSHSASKEIPCLLWNPKVHYCVNKSLSLVPVLSQMKLVHTFRLCFPKIPSNVTFPSMPRSFEWFLTPGFLTKILYAFLVSPMRVTCLPSPPPLDVSDNTQWSVHIMVLLALSSEHVYYRKVIKSSTPPPPPTICLTSTLQVKYRLVITKWANIYPVDFRLDLIQT
jgi:hypothetical protein